MTPFELRLLGEFRARDAAGQPVVVAARKNRALLALLALLALAPSGSMARERLAGLLWGGRGTVQAQSSLRQALVALRKELAPIGPSLISADNERVSLDAARVEIDAITFRRLAASDDVSPCAARRRSMAASFWPTRTSAIVASRNGWGWNDGGSPKWRVACWRSCARSSGARRGST